MVVVAALLIAERDKRRVMEVEAGSLRRLLNQNLREILVEEKVVVCLITLIQSLILPLA